MAESPKAGPSEALDALGEMRKRTQQARTKFAPGTSQHTLLTRRADALALAGALLRDGPAAQMPREAIGRAQAPLQSLMQKSEKARGKLPPDSWQHAMLERNLRALRLALEALEGHGA